MSVKKINLIFINSFLLLIILLAGCQKSDDSASSIKIGFSQGLGNHPLRTTMNHSMEIQASLHSEVDLHIFKEEGDVQKQISDIEQMMKENYQVIIISPIDSKSLVPVVEKAYSKGIPIILLDRKINSDKYTTYIGADNTEIGQQAAKYILSSNKSVKNIIEIAGADTSSPSVERSLGFQEMISTQKEAHLLKKFIGLPEEAFKKTLDSLQNKDLYVFAFNDELAGKAWQIARDRGVEKRIKFIGIDGLNTKDGGIQMVLDGKLNATFLYPSGGAEAIETAIKICNKKPVSKRIKLETTIIDRFNAEIMRNQFNKILEQQSTIEGQVFSINRAQKLISSQSNLLRLSITMLTLMVCLVAYCIYLIYTIKIRNKQLMLNNEKIIIQRNQIEKIANELRESNDARINFFTGLSHEFKTPMTLILSSLESLKDLVKNSGKKPPYELELINRNSNRLLRLVDNLLDSGR